MAMRFSGDTLPYSDYLYKRTIDSRTAKKSKIIDKNTSSLFSEKTSDPLEDGRSIGRDMPAFDFSLGPE
jgi:hypothetical protein